MGNNCYGCLKKSKTGRLIDKFFHSAQVAAQRADDFAKKMGASAYIQPVQYFEGGVDFLEFDSEPDLNTWHRRDDLGDRPVYEANCMAHSEVCILDDNRFTPSNTWDVIYNKEKFTWEQVKDKHPRSYWYKKLALSDKNDDSQNWDRVNELLKDRLFLTFIYFTDLSGNKLFQQKKILHRAVTAEKMRMALPVVRVEDFYKIVGLQMPDSKSDLKKMAKHLTTPTFFLLDDKYYIKVQGACVNDDLYDIPIENFSAYKQIALMRDNVSSCDE